VPTNGGHSYWVPHTAPIWWHGLKHLVSCPSSVGQSLLFPNLPRPFACSLTKQCTISWFPCRLSLCSLAGRPWTSPGAPAGTPLVYPVPRPTPDAGSNGLVETGGTPASGRLGGLSLYSFGADVSGGADCSADFLTRVVAVTFYRAPDTPPMKGASPGFMTLGQVRSKNSLEYVLKKTSQPYATHAAKGTLPRLMMHSQDSWVSVRSQARPYFVPGMQQKLCQACTDVRMLVNLMAELDSREYEQGLLGHCPFWSLCGGKMDNAGKMPVCCRDSWRFPYQQGGDPPPCR